ncbi:MAG: translocation/assembly module TamB domain-containing protein [Candidatus Eremiobacteraeota bacterium]|nr:translocation/assembly module TamB domain-containing protein [Candidatus Eremiobacteraeota bacterium]
MSQEESNNHNNLNKEPEKNKNGAGSGKNVDNMQKGVNGDVPEKDSDENGGFFAGKNNSIKDKDGKSGGTPAKPGKGRKKKILIIAIIILLSLVALYFVGMKALAWGLKFYVNDNINGKAEFGQVNIGVSGARIEDIVIKSEQDEKWVSVKKIDIKYNLFDVFKTPLGHKIIKSVDIYQPEVFAYFMGKDDLNLSKLIKEKEKKKKDEDLLPGFDFSIRIHNGKFDFSDNRNINFQVKADPVDGELKIKPGKWYPLNLKMELKDEGASVYISGKFNREFSGMQLNLKGRRIDAKKWASYILGKSTIEVNGGTFNMDIDFASDNINSSADILQAIDISGRAHLDDGSMNINIEFLPYPLKNLSADLIISKDLIQFRNVTGTINGAKFSFYGDVFSLLKPLTKMNIRFQNFPLEKFKDHSFFKSLPFKLSGNLSIEIQLSGFLENPVVEGNLGFKKIKVGYEWPPISPDKKEGAETSYIKRVVKHETLENGKFEFSFFNNALKFNLKNVNWESGSIKGLGWVNIIPDKDPEMIVEMNGENADVGLLVKIFFPDYEVKASADFDIKIVGTLEDPLVFGNSSFKGMEYSKTFLGSGSTHFFYDDQQIMLYNLNVVKNGGVLTSTGGLLDLKNNYMDFSLNARNFDFPTKLIPSLSNASMRSNIDAHVLGYFTSPIAVGSFSDGDISYDGNKVSDSSGRFIYFGNILVLGDAVANIQNSRVNLSGWAKLDNKASMQMVYYAKSLATSDLNSIAPYFSQLPSRRRINVSGFLSGLDNKYSWSMTGEGSLGKIAGFGRVGTGNGLSFSANIIGRNVDLAEFIPRDNQGEVKPGRGDIIVQSKGTPAGFKTSFITKMKKGKVLGLPVNAGRGLLSYSNGLLKLDDTYWAGYIKEPGRNRELANLQYLFGISDYWGADISKVQPTTTFARMYYLPYLMESATYTVDGWRVSVIKPVKIGSPSSLIGLYSPVKGLPPLWKNNNYFQLKKTGEGGFPIHLSLKPMNRSAEMAALTPVLDADIKGTVNLNSGKLNLKVKSQNLNMGVMGDKINLSSMGISLSDIRKTMRWDLIKGTAELDGAITGSLKSPSWKGKLMVSDGLINHEPFSLSSNFGINGSGAQISKFELVQPLGGYNGSGAINYRNGMTFNLNVNAKNGKLERLLSFTPWKNVPASGLISGKIIASGTLKNPSINCDLSVSPASIYGQTISSLDMKIRSGANSITLEDMIAKINGSKITGSGKMQNSDLDFDFKTDNLPLSKINLLSDRFEDISGNGAFKLSIKGKSGKPLIDLDFGVDDLFVREESFDRINGKIQWVNNSIVFNPLFLQDKGCSWDLTGSISFPDGRIPSNMDGWFGKDGKPPVFDLHSKVNKVKIGKILDLIDNSYQDKFKGTADGKFSLVGSFPRPDFDLAIQVSNGNMGEDKFDRIDTYLNYKKGIFKLERFEYFAAKSHALISGEINSDKNEVMIGAQVNNLPVEIFHPFVPQTRIISGDIFSSTFITGNVETPDMVSSTYIHKGKLMGLDFDKLGGHFTADKGVISFNDLEFRKDKEAITFKGKIPLAIRNGTIENTGELKIATDIRKNNLDVFKLFIPYIQETSGSLTGGLSITGKYPDISIEGKTDIRKGMLKFSFMQNPIQDIFAIIDFKGKRFSVKALSGKMGQGSFTATGFALLSDEKFRVECLNFIFYGKNLLVLIPELVSGKIDTKITLKGSQDDPVIGNATPKDYLRLKNATLTLPEGQLNNLSEILPEDSGKEKSGKNKTNEDRGKDIGKNEEKETAPEEKSGIINLLFPEIRDFQLVLGEDVWFDYKGLFVKTAGTLGITRKLGHGLSLDGKLEFVNGTLNIPLLAAPFKLTKGAIQFKGQDPPNPNLDFNAETTIHGIDIYMSYKGDFEDLKKALVPDPNDGIGTDSLANANLRIYSIPSLPRNDIMGLIVASTFIGAASTGSTDSLTSGNIAMNVLTNYFQSLFLAPITQKFGRALNLSEMSFEFGPYGSWSLRVSKAIDSSDRLYLTFGQVKAIQGGIVSVWGIEYKYRPGMMLRIENMEGAFIYWLQGQIQFDSLPEFIEEMFNIVNPESRRKKKNAGIKS